MKKTGKSFNLTSYLKPKSYRNSTGDFALSSSNIHQVTNSHNPSNSAVIPLEKSIISKVSIDIDEIRQEIKDRENRHILREKEFFEICQSVSYEEENPQYANQIMDTSETVPSPRVTQPTPTRNLFLRCCRKYCQLL